MTSNSNEYLVKFISLPQFFKNVSTIFICLLFVCLFIYLLVISVFFYLFIFVLKHSLNYHKEDKYAIIYYFFRLRLIRVSHMKEILETVLYLQKITENQRRPKTIML